MAEDLDEDFEEDVDEGDDSGGGRKGGKRLLFIVLPLLLVVGALAGAYFAGLADPILEMVAGSHQEGEAAPEVMVEGDGGPAVPVSAAVFYDLPEMLVDINSANSRKRTFLKLRVALELARASDTAQVEAMLPRVIDNFQVYLRELRVEDLQGAEGMYRLREELIVRVNNAVRPAKVNDVLFKEMLIQ